MNPDNCRCRFIAHTADSSALGLGSHVRIIVLISINGENVSSKEMIKGKRPLITKNKECPMAQQTNENSINWQDVGDETISRVRDLLRLDTRNPPGNEILAAEYLRSVLETEGISGAIVVPSSDRGTFIARLKGDGSAPPLLLMSHTDVVAVEHEKWTHSPFSGVIDDGFIYGRGALGMKRMVTMVAMT